MALLSCSDALALVASQIRSISSAPATEQIPLPEAQGRVLAQIVTATLMMAYALTGFAALHTLTLALKSRAFWLGCTYVIVVMFVWPVLAMVALGLADAIFGIRQRYLQRKPPPLPAS